MNRNSKIWMTLAGIVVLLLIVVVIQVFFRSSNATMKIAAIPEGEYDPAVWGKHYPLEYNSYLRMKEMAPSPTGFGGSEKVQKSVKEPEILINFKGMPFSIDYSEDRGHVYALEDLKGSKRINETTPAACMTCKTPQLIDVFKEKGWDYAKMPLFELLPKLKHPVVCANCHDPKTMNLRVINPAFIEAMKERGVDVSKAPARTCGATYAGSAMWSTILCRQTRKSFSPGARAFIPSRSTNIMPGRPTNLPWIGNIPTRKPRCSRPSIPISRRGAAACTGSPACPAPIATCPT